MAKNETRRTVTVETPPTTTVSADDDMSPHDEALANEAKIDEYRPTSGPITQFQSETARERALRASEDETEDAVLPAKLEQRPKVVQRVTDNDRMVRVRPRINVARFRYGKEWYQLKSGKEMLVPKHLALVLEQKGAI